MQTFANLIQGKILKIANICECPGALAAVARTKNRPSVFCS